MRVLITAANGALGRQFVRHLRDSDIAVTAAARGKISDLPGDVRQVAVGNVDVATDWSVALDGVTHVVHLAALTELMRGQTDDDFFTVNRDGTLALAEQASQAGVSRFIQISSAAVNGRISGQRPITTNDPPRPENTYARSKLAGEAALWTVVAATAMEGVVVRPPRIVWPDLNGNMRLFERLIAQGVPLPFGAVTGNGRDKVSPENISGLVALCLTHPDAPGKTFFATDGEPLSTYELTCRIAARSGRRALLLAVPPAVLRAIVRWMPARFLGQLSRSEMIAEILDSFRLDVSPALALGWTPRPNLALPLHRAGAGNASEAAT